MFDEKEIVEPGKEKRKTNVQISALTDRYRTLIVLVEEIERAESVAKTRA